MEQDEILLSIKRQYSKDEAVKIYAQELSECKIEKGMLKSEKQELEDANIILLKQVEHLKQINSEHKKKNKSLQKTIRENEASQVVSMQLKSTQFKLNRANADKKTLIHQLVVKSGHITKEEADKWMQLVSE